MRRHSHHHGSCGLSPAPRWRAAAWAGVIAAGALWAGGWLTGVGCTVTPQNYQLLSTFFDGVPDPTVKPGRPGARTPETDPRQSPTYTIHAPYANQDCSQRHAGRFRLSAQDSGVCLKCHGEKTSQHARMHGPVAAGACMWCHSPHESAYPSLLKKPPRQTCVQCHEPTLLSAVRVPAHADESQSCLDCHFGHGGPEPLFLRPHPSPPPPSPSPELPPPTVPASTDPPTPGAAP